MKNCALILVVSFFLTLTPVLTNAHTHTYQTAKLLNIDVSTELSSSGTTVQRIGHVFVASDNVVRYTNFVYTIQLDDVIYTSLYQRTSFLQHNPSTDFVAGTSVEIRIDKTKLYLHRPDGNEMKTKILKQELAPKKKK